MVQVRTQTGQRCDGAAGRIVAELLTGICASCGATWLTRHPERKFCNFSCAIRASHADDSTVESRAWSATPIEPSRHPKVGTTNRPDELEAFGYQPHSAAPDGPDPDEAFGRPYSPEDDSEADQGPDPDSDQGDGPDVPESRYGPRQEPAQPVGAEVDRTLYPDRP